VGGVKQLDWAGRGSLVALVALALACGSLKTPTEPAPENNSASKGESGVILGGPAPSPSPSASPSPSPEPGATPPPDGGGSGEGAGACGQPLPPAVTMINAKVHLRGTDNWVLDSTPLVGPDAEYCRKIGFTDNRTNCPVRPEGNPQRAACELYAIGRAKDTHRPGPTWYLDGGLCRGKSTGCDNHPDNQYLLVAYRGGLYRACAANGVCGEVNVE
jgi:hypothetical protein